MLINKFITSPDSLVTTHQEIRSGFLSIALEKNLIGNPYVKNASTFKALSSEAKCAEDLLSIKEIRPFLIAASGLSDKAIGHLNEEDYSLAIQELIDKFLKPAGENYIDEATFRYLLIKGDAVGGTMRNRIGAMGQEKFLRAVFSTMSVQNIKCEILHTTNQHWETAQLDTTGIEKDVKALKWTSPIGKRIAIFNATVPTIKKNVDICLYQQPDINNSQNGQFNIKLTDMLKRDDLAILYGELKGGIDPAGADEHWKTANSALNRIRDSYNIIDRSDIKTAFIGAAIEKAMAQEIYHQLESDTLTNAANLTKNDQLIEFCNWFISI